MVFVRSLAVIGVVLVSWRGSEVVLDLTYDERLIVGILVMREVLESTTCDTHK